MSEVQQQTITVDGVQYELSRFSPEVQQLIGIHQRWEAKAQEDRLEWARSDAAVKELGRELVAKIKVELEPAVAEEAVVDAPAE